MDLPGGDDGVPGICGLEEEKVSAPSLQATRAGGPRGRSVGAGIHGALPAGRPHQEKFVRRKSSRKCRARGASRSPWASALGSELGSSLGALSLHPPPSSRPRPRPLRSRVETPFPRGLAGAAGARDRAGEGGATGRRARSPPRWRRRVVGAAFCRLPGGPNSRPRVGSPRSLSARTMAPHCPRPAKRAARERVGSAGFHL